MLLLCRIEKLTIKSVRQFYFKKNCSPLKKLKAAEVSCKNISPYWEKPGKTSFAFNFFF